MPTNHDMYKRIKTLFDTTLWVGVFKIKLFFDPVSKTNQNAAEAVVPDL